MKSKFLSATKYVLILAVALFSLLAAGLLGLCILGRKRFQATAA